MSGRPTESAHLERWRRDTRRNIHSGGDRCRIEHGSARRRYDDFFGSADASGELAARRRKNVVQARSFAEMLERTLRRYQNRAIEAAQVIEELIRLAREMREAGARGVELGLSEEELAFLKEPGSSV